MQIKDRQQFLTILAIVAVSLLALDKIVAPPLTKFWDGRAEKLKTLRNEVHDGEIIRHRKDFIRNRWTEIQASTLTNNTTLAEQQLFSGLNNWSQSSGVSIDGITPQWKQSSDPSYKTLECRVDASGSIDRLSRFLYDLERDPMALKLQTVELTARNNDGQLLTMGVQVSALVLTPKEQKK